MTATSGDTAVIRRIRSEFESIERNLPRYRKVEQELDNVSTNEGHLTAYYEGDDLRKLEAERSFESGDDAETYYFVHGAPVFIFKLDDTYPNARSGVRGSREEDWIYLDSGVVIRRAQSGIEREPDDPGTSSADASVYTGWLPFYLRCSAAKGDDPPECSAPDSLSKDDHKVSIDAAGVARHRALYQDIERRRTAMKHARADLHALKFQGTTSLNGVLDAYCEGDSIRLLVADFTIPDARTTINMYFVHDSLFFVYENATRRDMAKRTTRAHESRWYFVDSQVVRWMEGDLPMAISRSADPTERWLARAHDLSAAMPACVPRLR